MISYNRRTYNTNTGVSWFILLCFLIGQFVVVSHHHYSSDSKIPVYSLKQSSSSQIITEKCNLCDMMHHMDMVMLKTTIPFILPVVSYVQYIRQHDYKGIALIFLREGLPHLFNNSINTFTDQYVIIYLSNERIGISTRTHVIY